MEIRSKLTINIPEQLVQVLGINEGTKFVPTFRNGKLELDFASGELNPGNGRRTAQLDLSPDHPICADIFGAGYNAGYMVGYDEGTDKGIAVGYEVGETEGYKEGYWYGYQDGKKGNDYDDTLPDADDEDNSDGECEGCPYCNK
jgi:hypothetical protein